MKKGDAYIVCCKNHTDKNPKNKDTTQLIVPFIVVCSRHTLITNISLQVQGFQVLVISFILPGDEEVQPPQEKQEEQDEETDSRLVLYDGKLFEFVNNVGDGLCLFYSVSSFLTELYSQEKSTFPSEWSKYQHD